MARTHNLCDMRLLQTIQLKNANASFWDLSPQYTGFQLLTIDVDEAQREEWSVKSPNNITPPHLKANEGPGQSGYIMAPGQSVSLYLNGEFEAVVTASLPSVSFVEPCKDITKMPIKERQAFFKQKLDEHQEKYGIHEATDVPGNSPLPDFITEALAEIRRKYPYFVD